MKQCTDFLTSGVMAARGMLSNPAMFAGYDSTPLQCVTDWVCAVRAELVTTEILLTVPADFPC